MLQDVVGTKLKIPTKDKRKKKDKESMDKQSQTDDYNMVSTQKVKRHELNSDLEKIKTSDPHSSRSKLSYKDVSSAELKQTGFLSQFEGKNKYKKGEKLIRN